MTATCRLALLMSLIFSTFVFAADSPFDLVITNGHIIDGTGSPWYSGDVGIRNGRIAAIGNLSAAARARTVDAEGKVVAPGFIDMLGQSETTILVDPRLPSKIYQGITTEITGEGGSAAPLNDTMLANDRPGYAHYKVEPDWRTFRQYFARLEKQGMGINLASYVGATQVRRMVLGDADVQPTPEQLEKMKALVREAMRDGAVGVSTALEYAPAPYSKTEEIIALASEASKFGGIYATHMRDVYKRQVTSLIAKRYPYTLQLTLASLFVAIILAIPAGVYSAQHRNQWDDRALSVVSLFGLSFPNFALGPVLILFFSVELGWLPVSGSGTLAHLVLPAITMGGALAAILTRMVRTSMLEELSQDYIRTARAKGLSERTVVYRHALRNAMIPILTVLGLQFGALLAGAIVTETIFSWPGIGPVSYTHLPHPSITTFTSLPLPAPSN